MPNQSRGMTLIEVLIALAIIAISMTAVIKAASQNIRATTYLKNKSIALWVAQELMGEVQTGVLKLDDNRVDEVGSMEMLGRNWFWRAEDKATGNARIKQIRVRVYAREPEDDDAVPLIDLDGYRYHAS